MKILRLTAMRLFGILSLCLLIPVMLMATTPNPNTKLKPTSNDAALLSFLEQGLILRKQQAELFAGAQGVLVRRVIADSNALKAGILMGDILVAYGDSPLNQTNDLITAIKANQQTKQAIPLQLIRNQQAKQIHVNAGRLGITFIDLSTPYNGDPVLSINTDMHFNTAKQMDVDAAERYMVTASYDKTVRVWSLADNKLVKILRPPVDQAQQGSLYAVAISKDGKDVAMGGMTGYQQNGWIAMFVYIMDRATGELRQRLGPYPNSINHLAYSKDGQYLAVALASEGIRIYQKTDTGYVLAAEDKQYQGQAYRVAFDPQGGLISLAADKIRLYTNTFQLKHQVANQNPKSIPFGVRYSPDGSKVAIAFVRKPEINVLSATDLSPLYSPNVGKFTHNGFSAIAWSADGQTLYAGGGGWAEQRNPVFMWQQGGENKQEPQLWKAAGNTIVDLYALKNGHLLFLSARPAWGMLDAQGKQIHYRPPEIVDFRDGGFALEVSADAQTIRFNHGSMLLANAHPVEFSLTDLYLHQGIRTKQPLFPPHTGLTNFFSNQKPALSITHLNTRAPKLNGQPIFQSNAYIGTIHSFALAADDKSFALGGSYGAFRFDDKGQQQWFQALPSTVWTINVSQDQRWLLVGLGDGSIRWLDYQTGEPRLALYSHTDGKRWILWRPDGYYTASLGGEDLIGWQISHGTQQAGSYYPASRFRLRYHDPVKVLAALQRNEKLETLAIEHILPPQIQFVGNDHTHFSSPTQTLHYQIQNPANAPAQRLRILVDGRPLQAKYISDLTQTSWQNNTDYAVTLTLPKQDVEIALLAENQYASSEPALLKLQWQGLSARGRPGSNSSTPTATPVKAKRRLLMLSVGVSGYQKQGIGKLKYPPKDASDIANLFKQQQGLGLYDQVIVKAQPDATLSELKSGLKWLENEAGVYDTSLIFIAGHGYNHDKDNSYYFLPADGDPDNLPETALKQDQITNTLAKLPGKVLLFLDTCHSGNVLSSGLSQAYTNRVANDLASVENGIVVFTASTGKQSSYESPSWENGAFTEALLAGLSGAAPLKKGKITFKGLDFYLEDAVTELVKQASGDNPNMIQTPATAIPRTISDFALATVKK